MSLFDSREYLGEKRRRLLDKSRAAVFRAYLLKELPVSELAVSFSGETGRPTKDIAVVPGALILLQLHDLTDSQTLEAVALSIQGQYARDIRHEADAYLCERTLRNYRRMVIERGLDEVMFRTLTDKLISSVGVDPSRQRLDSTAIRSAMPSIRQDAFAVHPRARQEPNEAIGAEWSPVRRSLPDPIRYRSYQVALQTPDENGQTSSSRLRRGQILSGTTRVGVEHLPRDGLAAEHVLEMVFPGQVCRTVCPLNAKTTRPLPRSSLPSVLGTKIHGEARAQVAAEDDTQMPCSTER